jgi:hypothetical protein
MAHKVSASILWWERPSAAATDPEAVAKLAVEFKSVPGKRVRHVASNQRAIRWSVHARAAGPVHEERAGIELTDDDLSASSWRMGPTLCSGCMNDITVIDRKAAQAQP